eukprot:1762496-Pleurochrysis_carterae.AAC.1
MHTDNAGDLTSKQIREFLLERPLPLSPSPPPSPTVDPFFAHRRRQNGAVNHFTPGATAKWSMRATKAHNGQGHTCKTGDLKTAGLVLVVPFEVIYRRLGYAASTRHTKPFASVSIHWSSTFLCGRATYRLSRLPENLPPAAQAVPAVNTMRLPWTGTHSA